MNNQSEVNKKAWTFKAYEFWMNQLGSPEDLAKDMLNNPETYVRRHYGYLGDVRDKKIANLLGSCGKKAIPLSILGADVTIVDISEQNKSYAMQLAEAAGVNLTYIVSDLLEWDISEIKGSFDIAYLEGGILHYFPDLNEIASKMYELLKLGGRLVLNDFHPFRKILKVKDIFDNREDSLELEGDYFDNKMHIGEVAHEKYFSDTNKLEFPKCLLRYWTIGEIITSFATAGFVIESFVEGPRFDEHKHIPGEFTLIAAKLKIER